jgi:hypothetical protein
MSKKAKPKQKSKDAPAEKRTGNVAQRDKDDRSGPRDEKSNEE